MITREADYAIRTVLYLSQHHGKGPVSTLEISESMEIPYRFLRKISHQLVEAKIAGAVRGKQGGIFLNVSPDKLSMLDILKIFDQRAITLNICCKPGEDCSRVHECPIHDGLANLQTRLRSEFDSFKFSDFLKGSN